MPELPEVETVRRGIEALAVGRHISCVEVGRERSVRRVGRDAVIHGLTDTTIVDARRRGKYLLFSLDTGDAMMIHLRMSGRVLIDEPHVARPLHTHVVLRLDETPSHPQHELRFVDPRTFGEVVVYDPRDESGVLPELTRMGVDPICDEFDAGVLENALRGRRGALKPLLLNQSVVAGIGNIYADEILHRAKLRWDRPADTLTKRQIGLLADAVTDILQTAITAGGSTLTDTQYVDVDGQVGSFQDQHRVYGRGGEICQTCGIGRIRRVIAAGRSTCFCPRCQR